MKRSVNFSSPRKFALLAELRGAHARPIDGEVITPDNAKRIDALITIYDAQKSITPAVILACAKTQFTSNNRNLANVILESHDAGWRVCGEALMTPEGELRKPARQWVNLFRYIEYAETKIASQKWQASKGE